MAINKQIRDKIVAQARTEIIFARQYKQARILSWKKNEDMYYAKKIRTDDSRANVELGKMQGFVHTVLSKIDEPLMFKFIKRKEADLKKADFMNALVSRDSDEDDWDIKDLVGKKQGVIYGRAVYCYYADSFEGYAPHLEPIDVYDFLIDPAGGGYNIELAFYMGRYGIVKTREQLKAGAKDGRYIRDVVNELTKNGSGNATETVQEEVNKQNRYLNVSNVSNRQISNPDKYKFWEWYTTFSEDGERYYLLMTDAGQCIRCELLTDIFPSGLFPFWTWACFPDMTEFWTPSFCDYVREVFMAQSISINQMLDNAEAINKPMKAVVVKLVENLAELKYRKDGYIRLRETDDIRKAFMTVDVPAIETPIMVYNTLEAIQELESGVTAAAKGLAGDTKVGIYEGNQAATADRFGLFNKSYAYGYKRFAKLYEHGVYDHLKKKIAIEILGAQGVELTEISRKDLYPKSGFGYKIQSSQAETNADTVEKRNKLTFLTNTLGNPAMLSLINPKKAFEITALIAGFDADDIRELLDTDAWGDSALMSEAARDIDRLLDGENVPPNPAANIAYKQKIVDWLRDHHINLDDKEFRAISTYIVSIEQFVMKNTVRTLNDVTSKMAITGPDQGGGNQTPKPAPMGAPAGGGPAMSANNQSAPQPYS